MKNFIKIFSFIIASSISLNSNSQTTVANGNWSSPSTWGGIPPIGSGTVVINHNVTLDMDYSHTSGSITISNSGSLTGNSAIRAFALNYPSGSASLTNSGSFNVARTALISNTVINNGNFQADSLLNYATISNNATINADQFMNATGGSITNNGSITAINFLNIETVNNSGNLSSNDFTNSKSFTNSFTGYVIISNDFSNIDTLASPAIFNNNGVVSVANNWHNGNQIIGSGKFCIGNYSWNSGTMGGTIDFCDQSGGSVDLNTGSIAGTVTFCVNSCSVNIGELTEAIKISIYPNPFISQTTLQSEYNLSNATITITNLYGETCLQLNNINGNVISINGEHLACGLYFIQLIENNQVLTTEKIMIQK